MPHARRGLVVIGELAGWFTFDALPRNSVTVRLYPRSAFTTRPAKGTALPASGLLDTVTTGTTHGGDGHYRFLNVAPGLYYLAFSYEGTIAWENHTVGPWNVKEFGAAGDGVTDDSAEIQAAIDLLEAAGGGVLTFPFTSAGYRLEDGLTINASNVRLVGDGALLLNLQAAEPVIDVLGTLAAPLTGVEIEGFRIVRPAGPGFGNNTHIQARYVNQSRFARIYSDNAGIDGMFLRNCEDVWIESCHFENPRAIGILAYECERLVIANCSQHLGGQAAGFGIGFEFKNCSFSRMIGCCAEGVNDYGFYAFDDGLGAFRSRGNLFQGCHSLDNAIGFYLHTSPEHQVVSCHAYSNTGSGIDLQGSVSCLVSGCYTWGNSGAGILVQADSDGAGVTGNFCLQNGNDGIQNNGATGTAITGNVCQDNGYPLAALAYSGIRLTTGSASVTVSGNTCGRTDTTNSKQLYGVAEEAGANTNVVIGNTAFSNLTAAFLKNGAASLFLNGVDLSVSTGTFQPASDAQVLTTKAGSAQTGLLFRALSNADALLFGIEADGDIRTSRTTAGTVLGSVTRKLQLFDASGNSVGFVPLYDAIS